MQNPPFGVQTSASIEAEITAAIAIRDFENLAGIVATLIFAFVEKLPKEYLQILSSLDHNIGPQFLATQLMTAFLRGWRSGQFDHRLDSAEREVKAEVDFLVSNPATDVMVIFADRINDYFCNAVWLFAKTADNSARLAAHSAAVVAQGEQRYWMVSYLKALAKDWNTLAPHLPNVQTRPHELANDIESQDWTVADAINFKVQLDKVNPEYLIALNGSDPSVFRHRFPDIFQDYDKWYPEP